MNLHDSALEFSLIGTLLTNPETIPDIVSVLRPEHFFDDTARTIYSEILTLRRSGKALNIPALRRNLEARQPDSYPWGKFLVELADVAVLPSGATHVASEVIGLFQRRSLYRAVATAQVDLEKHEPTIDVLARLLSACNSAQSASGVVVSSLRDIMLSEDWGERHAVVPTGLGEVDYMLNGGVPRKGLSVIGAKTGMGKTSFLASLCCNMAEAGYKTMFATYEMDGASIAHERMVKIMGSEDALFDVSSNISFYDPASMAGAGADETIETLCLHATAAKDRGLDVLLVDYIQCVGVRAKLENRHQRVGWAAQALFNISKRLDIAVVVASQLNRESKSIPDLADLKESGDIENRAHVVLFPVRDSYADFHVQPDPEEIRVYCKKHRTWKTGVASCWWSPSKTKFYD